MNDPDIHGSPHATTAIASGNGYVAIESAKLVPMLIVLSLLCGAAIGINIYAVVQAGIAERESRMLEYYVMEVDGKLMKAGIITPDESWSARKEKRQ